MLYLAHIIRYILQDHPLPMCFHRDLPEQINKPDGHVQILNVMMRKYVEEKPDEFKQMKTVFEIFTEQLNYLNMMLFHIEENILSTIFLE